MTDIKDGGPAFPITGPEEVWVDRGMTLPAALPPTTAAEHLIARIYALRDLVNLLASQAAAIERDTPLDNRDGAHTNARCARRALDIAGDKLSDCLTDLELRASIAALGADATDADYHAICEGPHQPSRGLWPELAASTAPIPPGHTRS